MPAGRENARKRKAPAAPRPVLTIEVIDGPTKGQKFTKQVRSGAIRETRARVRSHALAAVTRASRASPRVALGGVVVFFFRSGSSPLFFLFDARFVSKALASRERRGLTQKQTPSPRPTATS